MKFIPAFLQKNPSDKPHGQDDELQQIRQRILNILLAAGSILGVLAYFSDIFGLIREQDWITAGIETGVIAMTILLAVYEKPGYQVRAGGLLALMFILAGTDLVNDGLTGAGRLFLIVYVIMAFVLLRTRQAIASALLSLAAMVTVAVLMVQKVLPQPDLSRYDVLNIPAWILNIVVFALLAALCIFTLVYMIRGLENVLTKQKNLSAELEEERSRLEQRVDERTQELHKRAVGMEISNRLGQAIGQLNDEEEVLDVTGACFDNEFGYREQVYYLLDERQQRMKAHMARGEAGEGYVAETPVQSPGAPGTFAALAVKGDARLLRNRGDDAAYFSSALQGMDSALLLPMKSAGRVTGFVLLFSADYRELMIDDISLYQNLTAQAAAGVERARLIAMMERSMEDLRASARQTTQHNWRAYLRSTKRRMAYHYNREGTEAGAEEPAEAAQALKIGKVVVTPAAEVDGKEMVTLAAPIVLRGQPLGVIHLRMKGSSIAPDMMHLVEAVTKRLALALENARLVDEVQQRAEREAAVSAIATRVRASNDIDGILKTAAQELGRSLGVSEVVVQLRGNA